MLPCFCRSLDVITVHTQTHVCVSGAFHSSTSLLYEVEIVKTLELPVLTITGSVSSGRLILNVTVIIQFGAGCAL